MELLQVRRAKTEQGFHDMNIVLIQGSPLQQHAEEAQFTLRDTSGCFLVSDTIIQDPSFHGSLESTCLNFGGTHSLCS